jgi:hypothetical protein
VKQNAEEGNNKEERQQAGGKIVSAVNPGFQDRELCKKHCKWRSSRYRQTAKKQSDGGAG